MSKIDFLKILKIKILKIDFLKYLKMKLKHFKNWHFKKFKNWHFKKCKNWHCKHFKNWYLENFENWNFETLDMTGWTIVWGWNHLLSRTKDSVSRKRNFSMYIKVIGVIYFPDSDHYTVWLILPE